MMMNLKKKIGLGTVGLLALGGSVFGMTLISGSAGASSTQPPVAGAPATVDQGPNVQDGSQTALDGVSTSGADAVNAESAGQTSDSGEVNAASDGPGGHQDPAGNVDNQSTVEQ